jgi:hypothetical protein
MYLKENRMQTDTMEISISNELFEDEQLLWSGSPASNNRSVKSPRRDVFISSLICFVLGLLFTIATSVYNIVRFPDRDFNPFAGPLVLGGLFFLMGILVICCGRSVHSPPKNIFYAITDRRVIILCKYDRDLHVISYGKLAIHQIQRIEHPDGSGDLIFSGNAPTYGNFSTNANKAPYNSRLGAFTEIPNVRHVEQKLIKMLNET